MKKSELTQDVARARGVEPAVAADQMDRAVNRILRAIRSGHSAHLPGLGTISPGNPWKFKPEPHDR